MRNCLLVSEGVIHSLSPNSKLEPQTTRVKYRAARAAKTASKVVFVIFRLFPAASVVESCEGIWSQWSCPFSQALIRPLQVEWCFRYHVSVCKKKNKKLQQQRFAKLCYLKYDWKKMPFFTKISNSVSHLPSFVSLLGEISQFHLDFTISTRFHVFRQILQFQPDFTISTKFQSVDQILECWPNFTMLTKYHNFIRIL